MIKKILLALAALFLIAFVWIVVVIPGDNKFSYRLPVNCAETAVERSIINKPSWTKWWPGTKDNDSVFIYKNLRLQINEVLLNGIHASTTIADNTANVYFQVFAVTDSTSDFIWSQNKKLSANPFKKFREYIELQNEQATVKSLMDNIKKYFDSGQNVYGFTTTVERVKDTSLIAVKKTVDHYPATNEIYQLIDSVKIYLRQNGGKEIGYPMLNVYNDAPSVFYVMVAVPIEKDIKGNGIFVLKKMLPGELITTEIKGGEYTIRKSEAELKNYIDDHKRVSPAIPYQSLITDRTIEHDTAKWITKLYYPVFHK